MEIDIKKFFSCLLLTALASSVKRQELRILKLVTRYSLLVTILLLTGCGYTIQTKANLPFDTIAVGTIENRTREPKLQDMFGKALAETFAEYAFSVSPSARYRLEGTITKFELRPLVEQDLVATQYEVVIEANFRLIDTVSGAVTPLVAESPFITYFSSIGRLENVLAQKEVSTASAMKNLAQEVARRIIYR
jgi:outer membrane lipopolysaccharide assembly protein LptE/RlpB